MKTFASNRVEDFFEFVKDNDLLEANDRVHATGGGSYKYQHLFDQYFTPLGVTMSKHDEMQSLVNGMSFVLQCAKSPGYTVVDNGNCNYEKIIDEKLPSFEKPAILVSIGSGVSIIRVDDFDRFERVSGTMIGGGTLIGLSNLITGEKDFNRIIRLAEAGNHANVDMLVKDIYGTKSPFKELQGDLLASSFAKVANDARDGVDLRD